VDFFNELITVDVGELIATGTRAFSVIGAIIFAFDALQVMLDGRQWFQVEQGRPHGFMADDFIAWVRPRAVAIGGPDIFRVNIFVELEVSHRQADQLNERLVLSQDLVHGISSSNTVHDTAGIAQGF
jgi:hypothetical protein